ncbi:Bug family tripartite tricarboxylate transporter substrate binding protein [Roseomonas sp. CCTCC AB2023176]|uniref:Bug family tripartite tricarboxylate transporter substrate binding protein n=1 Tax=Roseomonas sp. CCTCC AB2023176 TaxID=3342640 RepID=UPI0035DC4149
MTGATVGRRAALGVLAAPALAARDAWAQGRVAWPSDKPVRIIVPLAAGGTADFLARLLAARLGDVTGLSFVVENRTGGSGAVGWLAGARAAPDGATLLMMDNSLPIGAAAGRELGFDARTDLEPLWLLAGFAPIVLVGAGSPARDLRGFVEFAKQRPEALFYGTNGIGSVTHLQTELLMEVTGMRLSHVPYRGMAQAVTDMIAGQIHLMLPVFPTVAGQVRSGAVRALAVGAEVRTPALRDVPTAREAGVDFAQGTWFGLMLPRGTGAVAKAAMQGALAAAMGEAAFRARLEEAGATVPENTADSFARVFEAELALWPRVLRERNIRIE